MTSPVANPGVQLLAYADRLAGDLSGVRDLLAGPLEVFSGVHLLPFFVPFDGADAGFDPVDHARVDPRLGSWADIRTMAGAGLEITADLVVNHVSAESAEFTDWLSRGTRSESDGMFLTFDAVFPDGANESDITRIYRPRTGLPFTAYQSADGRRRLVWTTFRPTQIDLDVRHPRAEHYLRRVLGTLAAGGVRTVRLDAIGYAVKTAGTDSFLTTDTLAFVEQITATAHELGLRVLAEVHAHHSQQLAIAALVDHVYDFALPPLLLHTIGTGSVDRLRHWLAIRPANMVTVLDTHDGIGVVDAGPVADRAGLLEPAELTSIFDRAATATGGESTRASQAVAWAGQPHQINSTFLAVLGGDTTSYLLARAVQLFAPGIPQIYYVGLLGGLNDMALYERTGEGRDVNRHRYTAEERSAALTTEVTRAQLALAAVRTRHPAFAGACEVTTDGPHRLQLTWTHHTHRAALLADVTPGALGFRIEISGWGSADSVTALAARKSQPDLGCRG